MTIDIRAIVTCSLGEVINGNFADDYLQGSGLIKTKGEVVLKGNQTPAFGTVVTFNYLKSGTNHVFPRTLRVLSSFSDPFRRTTTVQLGCKLTYLENRKPPLENPNTKEENNVPCAVYLQAMLPISAAYVLQQCLTALGLSSDPIPLTNFYAVEEFDLSPGYIQVISDLLQSEGYVGYLDTTETLRFRNLNEEGGTGPVIHTSDVIDVGPIGVGDLPGDSVVVRFTSERFRSPEDQASSITLKRNWETEETFGAPVDLIVSYTDDEGVEHTATDQFAPYSFTAVRYDVWDRKIESISLTTISSAEVNNRWASDAFKQGKAWNIPAARLKHETVNYKVPASAANSVNLLSVQGLGGSPTQIRTEILNQIALNTELSAHCIEDPDEDHDIVDTQTVQNFFSELELAGALNLDSYIPIATNGTEGIVLTFSTVATELESRVKAEFDTDKNADATKIKVSKFLSRTQTVPGQQDIARLTKDINYTSLEEEVGSLLTVYAPLTFIGVDTTIRKGRNVGLQQRPTAQERANTANSKPRVTESKADIVWVSGSTESTAVVEFTLPYAPDDRITWVANYGFDVIESDVNQKALNYGRIQNRLLLGNRNGLSLQLTPELMPPHPFDPLYIQAAGITGAYRVNGSSWAFDANGIVASLDALLWGAVSAEQGTDLSNSWIPLPPDLSVLPEPYPESGGELNPPAVIPPYTEQVLMEGVTRAYMDVQDYPYVTVLPDEDVTLLTYSKAPTTTAVGPLARIPITLSLGEYSAQAPAAGPVTKTRVLQVSVRPSAKQLADPLSVFGWNTSPYAKAARTTASGMSELTGLDTSTIYRVNGVAINPEGTRLVIAHSYSSSRPGYLKWWTIDNYSFTLQPTLSSADQPYDSGKLRFSYSGQYLFIADKDTAPYATMYRVTATGFSKMPDNFLSPAPPADIRDFKWSRDDTYLFLVVSDEVYAYKRSGEQWLQVDSLTVSGTAYSVAVNPTCDRVVVGSNTSPYAYDFTFENDTFTPTVATFAYSNRPDSADFSPSGQYLALGTTSGSGLRIFKFDGTTYSETNSAGNSYRGTSVYSRALHWGEDDRHIFVQTSYSGLVLKYDETNDQWLQLTNTVSLNTVYSNNSSGQWPLPPLTRVRATNNSADLLLTLSNNVYSFDPSNPRVYQNSNLLPRLGPSPTETFSGWAKIYDGDLDDGTVEVQLPFSVTLNNVSNNVAYVGSNSHVTFGEGYDGISYYDWPEVPKIQIWAGDYSVQRVYTKIGTDYAILRYEGYHDTTGGTSGSTMVWELTLIAPDPVTGDQVMEFRMGNNFAITDYWWWYDNLLICDATTILGSSDDYPDIINKSSIYTSDSTGATWTATHNASLLAI